MIRNPVGAGVVVDEGRGPSGSPVANNRICWRDVSHQAGDRKGLHSASSATPAPTGTVRNRWRRGLSLFVLLLLFFCLSSPASAHTNVGGNGQITGQLVDGSKRNAPIVGQMMTLQLAQGDNAQDVATTKTDAQGKFSFGNLATDKTINYAVYTLYQGAQYTTDLIALDRLAIQQIALTAYDATSSSARIAVLDGTILVSEPDTVSGTITISEIFFFKNLDAYTYVGSLDASKGKPNALLFSLPPNARNISLGTGFNGYNVIQVDRGFASNAAVPPGESQFAFSYQVPYSGSSYDFSYIAMYPTVQLSLLVPPALQVTPKSLTSGGVISANQKTYRSFKATKLLVQQEVQARLSGLSVPTTGNATSPLHNNLVWLLALLLIMAAIIFATALIARIPLPFGRKRRVARGQQARRGARGERGVGKGKPEKQEPREGKGKKEPKDRQKALLQELLDLDKAYEAGRLTKAVYQERRARTKARLRSIMSDEEAQR